MDKITSGIKTTGFQQPQTIKESKPKLKQAISAEPKDKLVSQGKDAVKSDPLIDEHLLGIHSARGARKGDVMGSITGAAIAFTTGALLLSNPAGWAVAGLGGILMGGVLGHKIGSHVGMTKAEKIVDEQKEQLSKMVFEGVDEEESRKNFRLVKMSIREGETLTETADKFRDIEKKIGNDKPGLARKIFKAIRKGESPAKEDNIRSRIFKCIDTASDPQTGFDNYNFVKEGLEKGGNLSDGLYEFNQVLDKVGNNLNGKAKELYTMLRENKIKPIRDEETQQLFRLMDEQGDLGKATDSFKYLRENTKEGEFIRENADLYLDVEKNFPQENQAKQREMFQFIHDTEPVSTRKTAVQQVGLLVKAEGNFNDALGNFKVIRSNLQPGETLESASTDFLKILNKVGSGETEGARNAFGYIRQTPSGEERDSEINLFFQHIDAENGTNDALGNYRLVKENLQPGESLENASADFLKILNKLGDGDTEGSRKIFSYIRHTPSGKARDTEIDLIFQHINAENGSGDALDNYKIIKENIQPGETLESASADFLTILNKVGDSSTEEARKTFNVLRNIPAGPDREAELKLVEKLADAAGSSSSGLSLAYGELQKTPAGPDREKEFELLARHIKLENSVEDAAGNFKSVKNNMQPGETLESATDDFLKILRKVGDSGTESARKLFAYVRQAPTGEAREKETELLFQHVDAENGEDDALGNFKLVKNNLDEGETVTHGSNDFLELIRKMGDSSTEDARKVFVKVRSYPAGEERNRVRGKLMELLDKHGSDTYKAVKEFNHYINVDNEAKELINDFINAENKKSDGIENLNFVRENLEAGETLANASKEFHDILAKTGNGYTPAARLLFSLVRTVKAGKPREQEKARLMTLIEACGNDKEDIGTAYQKVMEHPEGTGRNLASAAMAQLVKEENKTKDGIENFDIVKESLAEGETITQAADEFSEILKMAGNNYTPMARELFTSLRKNPAGEVRENEKAQLAKLIDAAGSDKEDIGTAYEKLLEYPAGSKRDEAFEAITKLIKQENKVKDGIENFDFVKDNLDPGETVVHAASEFGEILDIAGNNFTPLARSLFVSLRKNPAGKVRENDKARLLLMLDSCGSDKEDVGTAYEKLLEYPAGPGRNDAFDSMTQLIKQENKVKDGIENFDYVKDNLDQGETLSNAVKDFGEIINLTGNDYTPTARSIFTLLRKNPAGEVRENDKKKLAKMIKAAGSDKEDIASAYERIQLLPAGGYRNEAFECMNTLIGAENKVKDGVENFDTIKRGLEKNESLRDATGEFMACLKKIGNNNTPSIRAAYNLSREMPKGEAREKTRDLIFRMIDTENDIEEGIEDFKFVKDNKKKDESIYSAAEDFIGILKETGSKTREARQKFLEARK